MYFLKILLSEFLGISYLESFLWRLGLQVAKSIVVDDGFVFVERAVQRSYIFVCVASFYASMGLIGFLPGRTLLSKQFPGFVLWGLCLTSCHFSEWYVIEVEFFCGPSFHYLVSSFCC